MFKKEQIPWMDEKEINRMERDIGMAADLGVYIKDGKADIPTLYVCRNGQEYSWMPSVDMEDTLRLTKERFPLMFLQPQGYHWIAIVKGKQLGTCFYGLEYSPQLAICRACYNQLHSDQ